MRQVEALGGPNPNPKPKPKPEPKPKPKPKPKPNQVRQVEALAGGASLAPQDPERAARLIALCNGPLNRDGKACVQSGKRSSAALDALLREVSSAC